MNEMDTNQRLEDLLRKSRLSADVDADLHARVMRSLGGRDDSRPRQRVALAIAVAGMLALTVYIGLRLAAPPTARNVSLLPRIAEQLRCLDGGSSAIGPLWPASNGSADGLSCNRVARGEKRLRQEWLALKSDLKKIFPTQILGSAPPSEETRG